MSIYKTTIIELAKKHKKSVDEFIKELNEKGFATRGANMKLKQEDLEVIAELFVPIKEEVVAVVEEDRPLTNPNVLFINTAPGKYSIVLVDANIVNDKLDVRQVSLTTEVSLGEAYLEYNRIKGMNTLLP